MGLHPPINNPNSNSNAINPSKHLHLPKKKQACLCKYFGWVCHHPDTFLHLPASIRQRIYEYAGLTTDTSIEFPLLDNVSESTYDILRVCRATRKEVVGIILSQNTILLPENDISEGLLCLARLSPYACSQLRDLCVHLYNTDYYYYIFHGPKSLHLLRWDRIELWQCAMTNILSHASPRQLKLHLICDVRYIPMDKIDAVFQPLLAFPNVLLDIELRLSDMREGPFCVLARETAYKVIGPDPNARPDHFRFLDLPEDIRRHIFTYTNLVTPFRKVQWSSDYGFHITFPFCECDGDVCRDDDLHHGRQFIGCEDPTKRKLNDKFCSRYYSTYSSRCEHMYNLPTLMLVNRAMYKEASAFFYSYNRIIILPHHRPEESIFAHTNVPEDANEFRFLTPIHHDSTKLFLDKLRPEVIHHIRSLEIVFPRIGPDALISDTDSIYRQWCLAVELLAARVNLPRLTLVVHIWTTIRRLDESEALITHSTRLLSPLRSLSRLNRLFVHLEYPNHWAPPKLVDDLESRPGKHSPGCGIGEFYIPYRHTPVEEMEMGLERMVMGEGYVSNAAGKEEELPSPWLRSAWGTMQ